MWNFIIGFVIGFAIATYGVQNSIDKVEAWADSGKELIEKYSDDDVGSQISN